MRSAFPRKSAGFVGESWSLPSVSLRQSLQAKVNGLATARLSRFDGLVDAEGKTDSLL
jgi:hypothetical protein